MPINDFLTQIDAGALKKRLEIPAGQQPGNKGNSSEDRDTFSRSLAEESQRTRESNPSETNRDAHANENQKPDRPQPTRQDTEQEKAHSQDEIREPNGNQPVAEPQPDQNSKIENGSETSSEKKFQGIETRALENVSEIKPANDFALELTQAENFTPITVLTQIVETEQTQTTAPASLQFIFEENELEIEHSTDEPDVIAIDASPLIPPAGLFDVISTTDQDSIDQNEIANGTIEIVETPAEVLPEIPTIQIPLPSSDSTEQTESQPVDNQLSIDQQTDNVNIPNSEIGIEIPNTETPDKLINVEPEHQSEVSEIIESEKPQTQVISHQETVPTVKANHNDAVNQTPSEEPPHSDEPQNASQTASVTTSTGQNESTASLAVSPGYIKPDEPQDTASPKAENQPENIPTGITPIVSTPTSEDTVPQEKVPVATTSGETSVDVINPTSNTPVNQLASQQGIPTGEVQETNIAQQPVNPSSQAGANRLADMVQSVIQQGRPMRIQLNPPELGVLQIEISVRAGSVTARFDVQTSAARQTIVENLSSLQESFAQNGTIVDRIEVQLNDFNAEDHASEFEDQMQWQDQDDNQQPSENHQGELDSQSNDNEQNTASPVTAGPSGSQGTVDKLDIQI